MTAISLLFLTRTHRPFYLGSQSAQKRRKRKINCCPPPPPPSPPPSISCGFNIATALGADGDAFDVFLHCRSYFVPEVHCCAALDDVRAAARVCLSFPFVDPILLSVVSPCFAIAHPSSTLDHGKRRQLHLRFMCDVFGMRI